MRMTLIASIALIGGMGSTLAEEAATLYPADVDWISNGGERGPATAARVLVRFDVGRIRNPDKLARVRLRLLSAATQPEPGPVDVLPLMSDWGALSPAFRDNEGAWIRANADGTLPELLWEQRGKSGQPLRGSLGLAERWRMGNTDWTWAVYPVCKWKAPGGDMGKSIGEIAAGNQAASLDIAATVKSWLADGKSNFGLLLRLRDEQPGRLLDLHGAVLELEGDGVAVEPPGGIDAHPAWLPRSYRVKHPRFAYPTQEWLAAVKAEPKPIGRLGRIEQLALQQRLSPTPERAAQLSALATGAARLEGVVDLYGLGVLYDWGFDLLAERDRQVLALRVHRLSNSACSSSG